MSDPVSNSEIEDVLASIRRLVSENAKALKGDRSRDAEAEKLVLTPALRIDESETPSEETDVFAVDSETWNEVAEKPEDAENKAMFSHRPQAPVAEPAPAATEPAAEVASGAAPETDPVAVDTGAAAQASETAQDVGAGDNAAPADATAANTSAEPQVQTELEQQIAELESAMDLQAEPAASGTEDGPGTDPVAEDDATETENSVSPSETEAPAAPSSDAPPRSWIEGLVAAAAAAEVTRISQRETPAEELPDDTVSEDTNAEDLGEPAVTSEPEDAASDAQPESAGEDIAAADEGTRVEEAAKPAPFELTAAHAAPVEDQTADENEADESEAAETVADEVDHVFDAPKDVADEAVADEAERPATVEEVADTAGTATDSDNDTAQEPGPERSWVDRLIAAAATLKATPLPDSETNDTENAEADPAGVTTDEDTAGSDDAADEIATADAEDESAAGAETEAPAPLSLDNPIEPEAEALSAVAEWEEVDPPAEAAPDEVAQDGAAEVRVAEEAPAETRADEDPIVDIDTVLTGPWTAGDAGDTGDADEEVSQGDEPDVPYAETAADSGDAPTDAFETADPDTAAAGALEWEPVEIPETDALADAETVEAVVATAEDADDTAHDIAHDEADAKDLEWETAETPADPVADTDEEVIDEVAEATTEDAAYDADSAAIAAAVEADDDWTEADSTAASDLGMAAAAASGLAATSGGTENAVTSGDETLIDEEMLREMVAQLVRDELQGTVGERITHNVRRLIRREIARALTLQDFEK